MNTNCFIRPSAEVGLDERRRLLFDGENKTRNDDDEYATSILPVVIGACYCKDSLQILCSVR